MKVVVIGGKLQGVEAAYLCRELGWEVILIDKLASIPALGLSDAFFQIDVTYETDRLKEILEEADFVIPALEDSVALKCLRAISEKAGVPIVYDPDAYAVSSSKKLSDTLFAQRSLPAPKPWPKCELPVIVKPSGLSGSRGVRKIETKTELYAFLNTERNALEDWVIQEYLEGPSFSIEVIGYKGEYVPLQITDLEMDPYYDCKRVTAPTVLGEDLQTEFRNIAIEIARAVNLSGIMDVEVILNGGELKILEIDARLPSQTPTTVVKSSGINMVELLYNSYKKGALVRPLSFCQEKAVIYEHIRVSPSGIESLGEHVMVVREPLYHYKGLFGADEIITNFREDRDEWVATLIIKGNNKEDVWKKRFTVIEEIKKCLELTHLIP